MMSFTCISDEIFRFDYQGLQRRIVLVVILFVFLRSNVFALLLQYVTWCTMWRLYMASVSC